MKTGALVLALVAVLAACSTAPSPPSTPRVTALVGGRVLPSPQAAAIPDGVVLLEGTTTTAVGSRATLRAPAGATVVDCTGGTLTSGFWNSHVHFTGSQFRGAETAGAEALVGALRAMVTSYGVVHVVDTGSLLANTLALRRGIDSGEIPGPSILTAGAGFAPAGGSPYYILPARLPELARPEDVARVADLGGELLFGTDVGYMTDYDPTDEFIFLRRAGLGAMQILAMLTTAPAARFGRRGTGRIGPGMTADVVVLDGDPTLDVRAFAKVRMTMRDGRVIYRRT